MAPTKAFQDHYAVLAIPSSSEPAEIKAAYRRKALQWHPDKNTDSEAATEQFQKISTAYEVLSNPQEREFYDIEHRNQMARWWQKRMQKAREEKERELRVVEQWSWDAMAREDRYAGRYEDLKEFFRKSDGVAKVEEEMRDQEMADYRRKKEEETRREVAEA